MKRHSRSYDICGRYGDDEFMVLMPGGTHDQAAAYAERLLRLFLDYAVKYRNAGMGTIPCPTPVRILLPRSWQRMRTGPPHHPLHGRCATVFQADRTRVIPTLAAF